MVDKYDRRGLMVVPYHYGFIFKKGRRKKVFASNKPASFLLFFTLKNNPDIVYSNLF